MPSGKHCHPYIHVQVNLSTLFVMATNRPLPPLFHTTYQSLQNPSSHCCHAYCSPEIAQLHLTVLGDQDVLRFHVTMEDSPVVQVKEGGDQLARNDLDLHGQGGVVWVELQQSDM